MLCYLLGRANDSVSIEEIFREIWPDVKELQKNAVIKCKAEINETLGLTPNNEEYIQYQKESPAGYVLRAEVQTLVERRLILLDQKRRVHDHVNVDDFVNVKSIDMIGWNLNRLWFNDGKFVRFMKDRAADLKIRILLPHPESPFMQALIEDRRSGTPNDKTAASRLIGRYAATIKELRDIQKLTLDAVRVLNREMICCGMVRFDKLMVVTIYTFEHEGTDNLVMLLNQSIPADNDADRESEAVSERLQQMFEKLWGKGTPLDEQVFAAVQKLISAADAAAGSH
jgi:hypothetical protein